MRQIFLDTETTGLSAEGGDRLIEIGCIEMVNRRLTGNHLHLYVNPQRPSSEEAFQGAWHQRRVPGRQAALCRGGRTVARVRRRCRADHPQRGLRLGFIDAELKRAGREALRGHVAQVTDSLLLAREMFPGKSNSLDALCRRLEVDNSSRSLHGALLDAGLLAEVYIRLTRGQDSLVIDAGAASSGAGTASDLPPIDLRALTLYAVAVNDEEQAAHEALLADLDKASGGKTVWRRVA